MYTTEQWRRRLVNWRGFEGELARQFAIKQQELVICVPPWKFIRLTQQHQLQMSEWGGGYAGYGGNGAGAGSSTHPHVGATTKGLEWANYSELYQSPLYSRSADALTAAARATAWEEECKSRADDVSNHDSDGPGSPGGGMGGGAAGGSEPMSRSVAHLVMYAM